MKFSRDVFSEWFNQVLDDALDREGFYELFDKDPNLFLRNKPEIEIFQEVHTNNFVLKLSLNWTEFTPIRPRHFTKSCEAILHTEQAALYGGQQYVDVIKMQAQDFAVAAARKLVGQIYKPHPLSPLGAVLEWWHMADNQEIDWRPTEMIAEDYYA